MSLTPRNVGIAVAAVGGAIYMFPRTASKASPMEYAGINPPRRIAANPNTRNVFETQGVKNVGSRYAAQGGSNTHLPGVATPLGIFGVLFYVSLNTVLTLLLQVTRKTPSQTKKTRRVSLPATLRRIMQIRRLPPLRAQLSFSRLSMATRRANKDFGLERFQAGRSECLII